MLDLGGAGCFVVFDRPVVVTLGIDLGIVVGGVAVVFVGGGPGGVQEITASGILADPWSVVKGEHLLVSVPPGGGSFLGGGAGVVLGL